MDRELAGLARADPSPALTEAIRRRMHERLGRTARRRSGQESLLPAPHRWAADAALAAVALLLYVAVVVRQALDLYQR